MLRFLLKNCETHQQQYFEGHPAVEDFMDMDQDSAILWTWIKIRANSFIKTLVNNVKRKLTKVPWTLSLTKKNATPHFKEHCTKIDISVAVIHFFFSQTSVVFNITHYLLDDILDGSYLLIFTFILRILKFIQCFYAFFIKNSKVLIRFNVLFIRFSSSKCCYLMSYFPWKNLTR